MFFGGGGPHHRDRLLHQFADIDTTLVDAQLTAIGPGGFEQVADHGVQLIHALEDGPQVIGLIRRHRACQPV